MISSSNDLSKDLKKKALEKNYLVKHIKHAARRRWRVLSLKRVALLILLFFSKLAFHLFSKIFNILFGSFSILITRLTIHFFAFKLHTACLPFDQITRPFFFIVGIRRIEGIGLIMRTLAYLSAIKEKD